MIIPFSSFSSGLFCCLSLLIYFKRRRILEKVLVFHYIVKLNACTSCKEKQFPGGEMCLFTLNFAIWWSAGQCVPVKRSIRLLNSQKMTYADRMLLWPTLPVLYNCAHPGKQGTHWPWFLSVNYTVQGRVYSSDDSTTCIPS